jgi:hypothetical protein
LSLPFRRGRLDRSTSSPADEVTVLVDTGATTVDTGVVVVVVVPVAGTTVKLPVCIAYRKSFTRFSVSAVIEVDTNVPPAVDDANELDTRTGIWISIYPRAKLISPADVAVNALRGVRDPPVGTPVVDV